jgi:hypothetical protein
VSGGLNSQDFSPFGESRKKINDFFYILTNFLTIFGSEVPGTWETLHPQRYPGGDDCISAITCGI